MIDGVANPMKERRERVRRLFEETITRSKYRDSTPLGAMTINDEFSHYMDPDTDTLWIGFVLGVEAAEELNQHRSALLNLVNSYAKKEENRQSLH